MTSSDILKQKNAFVKLNEGIRSLPIKCFTDQEGIDCDIFIT